MPGTEKTFLNLQRSSFHPQRSFLDYIFGGTEIGLQFAIDLSLSNQPINYENSLHYMSKEMINNPDHPDWKKNIYYQTLKTVTENLEKYDSDGMIAMYGFGAIIPGGKDESLPNRTNKAGEEEMPVEWTSNCFAMNGNAEFPFVKGVDGVLDCYKKTVPLVEMYGPTYFSHFLSMVNDQM